MAMQGQILFAMASSKCLAPPGIRKGSIDRAEGRKGNRSLCFCFILSVRDLGQKNKTKCVVWDSLEFYTGALCWYPSKSEPHV